jgi:biotin synthase
VVETAKAAKAQGATRFCMGAAWRGPKERELENILGFVRGVKALGLETCATLGMLKPGQVEKLRSAGLESRRDRAGLISQLASLDPYPESVPINALVRVEGTPLGGKGARAAEKLDDLEFVRTIAAARITMPKAWVRLSAGRESMSDAVQALCFLAGANSVFYGEKLLTTANPQAERDRALFSRLGLRPAGSSVLAADHLPE